MNTAELLRRATSLVPGALTVVAVLLPSPGYDLQKNLAVATCFAVFIISLLMRSDGLQALSLAGLGVILALAASHAGFLVSFAVVTSFLVLFDVVNVVKSLFGLTYPRIGQGNNGAPSAYLEIIKRQAVRSFGLGLVIFLVSVAVVSTPIPLIAFANPVSGSGILALAALLLIMLAASGADLIRRVPGSQVGSLRIEDISRLSQD